MKTLQSNLRNSNKSWFSKQRNSLSINSNPSFIRFKKRLNTEYDQIKVLKDKKFNVQREYLIEKNSRQKRVFQDKNCNYRGREKQKIVKRDKMSIEYENQLKTEINQINQTLKIANQIIQKSNQSIIKKTSLIQQKSNPISSEINFPYFPTFPYFPSSTFIAKYQQTSILNRLNKPSSESSIIPSNILQLIQIQQKIKNKERQNRDVQLQIQQLKENIYSSKNSERINKNKKQHFNKKANKQNQNRSRINQYYFNEFKYHNNQNILPQYFILATQIHQLNQQLIQNINLYNQKYQEFMNLKKQIEEFKTRYGEKYFHVSYEKFCENKIKRQIQKQNKLKQKQQMNSRLIFSTSSRLSSKNIHSQNQSIRPSRFLYYSNISNISGLFPSRNSTKISKRQYLHNLVPSLPKQKNPTLKSLNNKRQKLRKALEIQKYKYFKDLAQNFDKIPFLRDQDLFLSEQINFLINQIDELQQKFSYCQSKSQISIQKSKYRSIPLKQSKSNSNISFFRDINNYQPISHINCQSRIEG